MTRHFDLYLHGFSSNPASNKAQVLKRFLAERGIDLQVPDLNRPSFADLTVSAALAHDREKGVRC